MMRHFFFALIISQITACSGTTVDFTEKLEIAMNGAFAAPADAVGNSDPKSLTFTLTGVTLSVAGQTPINLYEGLDPKEFRIISRAQLLLEADLSTYVGKECTEIAITFAKAIKGAGKYSEELTTSLSDPVARYSVPFKVLTGKTLRLEVGAQWKNTLTTTETSDPPTESLTAPALVLDLKNDEAS